MDLTARKYEFIEQIFDLDDNLFVKLEAVLKRVKKEPKRTSLEQYNKEIDEAIFRVIKGEFYTQEEAETIMDKW